MPRNLADPGIDPRPSEKPSNLPTKQKLIFCLLLAVITLLLYNRIASAGFINFDDPQYVLNNAGVREGIKWSTIKWAFTTYEAGNWHPLTWISHVLDYQLFQLNPAGHHYVNVLFHTANAVLLFLLLLSATRRTWPSWAVAAVWAIHPVNVESVAWVAERKNVLSMFFFLLALYAYGKFTEKQTIGRYGAVALLFALGLMAKPQVITFPLVLILWDYWPLQRLDPPGPRSRSSSLLWLAAEKLPLFLLSATSAFITLQAQRSGEAVRTIAEYSVSTRVENALISYVRYLAIAFWPSGLSPIYPHPENSIPGWQAAGAAALLIIVAALVFWQRRQRRYLLVGWLWFLGALIPMIGLVQVGQQAMADRYAYLPFVGLLVALVWALAELVESWNIGRAWVAAVSTVILVALGVVTYRQLGYWRDSEVLWTRALAVTEKNYTAHSNLANALARSGRSDEAILHFEAAEQIHPYPPAQVLTLGLYEQQHGHLQGAIQQFKQASRASDASLRCTALANLGSTYLQTGNQNLAKESFAEALQANPTDPAAMVGNGLIAYGNDPERASRLFARAVAIEPTDVRLLLLATALQKAGHTIESKAARERAQRASSNLVKAQSAAEQLLGIQSKISN